MYPKRRKFHSYVGCPSVASTSLLVPVEVRKYNSLRCHQFKGNFTGEDVFGYADDVYLLLMQKNFDKVNGFEYQSYLKEMALKIDSVKPSKRPKMTDNQLMSYIKSRHCQSQSEVASWMSYLAGQFDIVKSERDNVLKSVEDLQQQQQQQQQQQEQ